MLDDVLNCHLLFVGYLLVGAQRLPNSGVERQLLTIAFCQLQAFLLLLTFLEGSDWVVLPALLQIGQVVNLCVGLRLLNKVQFGFQSLIILAHPSGSIVERIPKLSILLAFEFEFLLACMSYKKVEWQLTLTKCDDISMVKSLSALNLVSLQVSPSD